MESHFKEGDVVEVARKKEGFEGSWYIATILRCLKMKNKMSFLIKYHSVLYNQGSTSTPLRKFINADDIRPQPPLEKTAYFRLNEQVDAFFENGWWFGVIIKVLDGIGGYSVHLSTKKLEKEFGPAELRRHLEWVDGAWVGFQDQGTSATQQNQSGVESSIPTGGNTSSNEMPTPQHPSAHKYNLRKSTLRTPRNLYQETSSPSASKKAKRKIELIRSKSCSKISPLKRFRGSTEPRRSFAIARCLVGLDKQTIQDEQIETTQTDAEPDKDCGREMMDMIVQAKCSAQLSYTAEKHIPLSALLQKSNYPSTITPETDATESIHIGKSLEIDESSYSLDAQTIPDGDNNSIPRHGHEGALTRSSPFVKSSPLWVLVESMEAFQLMPQQPHFRPLKQHNEGLQQGMAIGYMISFADLVKGTNEAKVDGPWKNLEDKLTILVELEKQGFTVQKLRKRLEVMLRANDKYKQLDDESKAMYKQIIQATDEKDKLEAKINDLKETITQLNKKLQFFTAEKKT